MTPLLSSNLWKPKIQYHHGPQVLSIMILVGGPNGRFVRLKVGYRQKGFNYCGNFGGKPVDEDDDLIVCPQLIHTPSTL